MQNRFHITVRSNGRLVIPAELRQRYGITDGGQIVLDAEDDGMHLKTIRQSVVEAQAFFSEGLPEGTSVAAELISDRRDEALRE